MFGRAICLLSLLAAFLFSTPSEAWTHGAVSTAPVLTNTTVTLGQQTQAFYGYVFLHQQNQTIPSFTPTTVYGLGLMSPSGTPCATWYVTFVSGRSSSDFLISSPVADASAITPNVSGTGQGNLTGDYVWQYQCQDAGGHMSNTATLTIHTIANAVNIGDQDPLGSGAWAPNNFGSTPGAKILLSTGGDFHAKRNRLFGVTLGGTGANPVTITVADSPRYPYVSNFTTSGLSAIDVKDIVATGNTDVAVQDSTNIFGSDNVRGATSNETWENLHYYGSMALYPSTGGVGNSEQNFFGTGCSTNCLFKNSSSSFTAGGFNITDGLTVQNVDIGFFYDNCMFIASMQVGASLDNTGCHDFLYPTGGGSGLHTDCMQVGDGATAYLISATRLYCLQAGAIGYSQGPWFGGTQVTSMQGYIDDGTGAHNPGHILTVTSGSFQSQSDGAQIWSPGNITIAQNVRLNGNSSPNTLSNLANTVIGSPGSPVSIYNVGVYGMQIDGMVTTGNTYHAVDTVGESGTSFIKHFAIVNQTPNPYGSVSFTGSVNGSVTGPSGTTYPSGTTISVTSSPTPSSMTMPLVIGGYFEALNYPGCPSSPTNAFCNLAAQGNGSTNGLAINDELYSNESVQATGTASFSGSNMTITGPCTGRWDYDVANGAKGGGLMIQGAGVPDGIYIIPQLFLPSDGCAGTYGLNSSAASGLSGISVSGRPRQKSGVYSLAQYGTGATPTGSLAMTGTPYVGIPPYSYSFYQLNCITAMHQGTFTVSSGISDSGFGFCGAPVTNTVTSNLSTPVAADYATGILPSVSLSAVTAATWDALDPNGGVQQKLALTCNKMLPKVGGALDLGGGVFIGPFTATGEWQITSGNQAITGCGIH